MSDGPVIVKLGGSIITRKREPRRLRRKILTRLAHELAAGTTPSMILLHGAGSFGHPNAQKFGLARPPESGERRRSRGALLVSAEVRELHQAVLTSLNAAGALPVSVPAYPIADNHAGVLQTLELAPFRRAVRAGLMPVSFGDVVHDDVWQFSILSADTLAIRLAQELGASRVVFVSDVEGVLVPGPDGRRRPAPTVDETLISHLRPESGGTDVTGGIRAKAEAMMAIARGGTDAVLISGLRDGALLEAIRGDSVYGSWARASPR